MDGIIFGKAISSPSLERGILRQTYRKGLCIIIGLDDGCLVGRAKGKSFTTGGTDFIENHPLDRIWGCPSWGCTPWKGGMFGLIGGKWLKKLTRFYHWEDGRNSACFLPSCPYRFLREPPLPSWREKHGLGWSSDEWKTWSGSKCRPNLEQGIATYSHMLASKIKPCTFKYKLFCTMKMRMAH